MSAQFVDALKGYEFYISNRGKVSIHEINDYLVMHGYRMISTRTYGHYRKLISHGFRGYIPINKFDVFQSLGKIQLAADRRRYERRRIDTIGRISRNGKIWHNANFTDESIVGFGITSRERFIIKPGSVIMITLQGYGIIPVVVVWRKHMEFTTQLGVRAFEFVPKYRLPSEDFESDRLTGIFQISREAETDIEWQYLFRILEKTDEMLNAVFDLVISIGDTIQKEVILARPVISSIKFGSPGGAEIKIDFGVAEILRVIFEKLQFWRLEKRRYIAETNKIELENTNLQIEAIRNALNLIKEIRDDGFSRDLIDHLSQPIKDALQVDTLPISLFEVDSLERGILEERVLSAAAELIAGDDLDFRMDVSLDQENQ